MARKNISPKHFLAAIPRQGVSFVTKCLGGSLLFRWQAGEYTSPHGRKPLVHNTPAVPLDFMSILLGRHRQQRVICLFDCFSLQNRRFYIPDFPRNVCLSQLIALKHDTIPYAFNRSYAVCLSSLLNEHNLAPLQQLSSLSHGHRVGA